MLRLVALWTSAESDGIVPGIGKPPVWDFASLWAGGLLARTGELATLFDETAYRAWLRAFFSPRFDSGEWIYPPGFLLVGAPLSLLGVQQAFVLWVAGGAAALFLALRAGRLGRAVCVLALLSPAMIETIIFGQNGAYAAALFCGALLAIPTHPARAGLLAGLLTIKPQLGLVIPIAFLMHRAWVAILVAGLTALAIAGAATLAFGLEIWPAFWTRTRPLMLTVLLAPWPSGHLVNGVSVFFSLRQAGAELWLAQGMQAGASLAALAAAIWAWRLPGTSRALRLAATAPLALLATPYANTYDLVPLVVAALILLARDGWRLSPVVALAWIWPGLASMLAAQGWPVTPVVLLAVAVVAGRALAREAARARGDDPIQGGRRPSGRAPG